jgi:hypothetical protein
MANAHSQAQPSSSPNIQTPQKANRNRHLQMARLMLLIVLLTAVSGLLLLAFVPSSAVAGIIFVIILICISIETMIALLLLIKKTNHALQRVNEAEEVSHLLQQLAEREHAELQQKVQLESSIQVIVQVLTQYANGNWQARVPLDQSHVLWHLASALNNLLARLVHLRQENQALREVFQSIQERTITPPGFIPPLPPPGNTDTGSPPF